MSINWTQRSTPTTYNNKWRSICYAPALDMYCAVGTQNSGSDAHRIMTSVDGGVTWIAQAAPSSSYSFFGVCWSPTVSGGMFVAVGSANLIATSPDGVNWSAQTGPAGANNGNNTWNCVCWSPGISLFIAANTRGTGTAPAASHNLMSSADGVNWTGYNVVSKSDSTTTNGFGSPQIVDCPGISKAIIVGLIGSTRYIFTTTTGTSTTYQATNSSSGASSGTDEVWVAWCQSLTLAACVFGRGDNPIYTSPDGVTWTQQTQPTTGSNRPIWKQLIGTTAGFIGVGLAGSTNTHQIIESTNGTVWTESDPSVGTVEPWNYLAAKDATHLVGIASNATNDGLSAMGGTPAVMSLSPTSSRDSGDITVTITGDGVNGGFTNQGGIYYIVVFYPFAALGASPPDFVTNYYPNAAPWSYGLRASNVTWVNSHTLTCTPPNGCGNGAQYGLADGPISVDVAVFDMSKIVAANCQFYLAAAFTYVDPVMLSVSPTTGTVLGGETITITGTNFYPDEGTLDLGTNKVVFGQANSFCTYVNATTLTCVAPSFYGGVGVDPLVDLTFVPSHLSAGTGTQPFAVFVPASTILTDAYTYTPIWWKFDPTLEFEFSFFDLEWEDFDFGYGIGTLGSDQFSWYYNGLISPSASGGWAASSVPSDTNGWWISVEGFAGSVLVVANSRPKDPRTWANVATFATSTAAMLGGSPGYACVVQNKLVYAATGYTTFPSIRIFDGAFDRELCTLPPTAAGATPYAIVSILAANGTIYLSTLDTGTNSTNWVGRVFELDIATAQLTPIGAAFTTGHVPYALAWHNGRLYCGTHRQVSTAVGKIYTILPGVDTAWVEDYDLSSASMAGVASMLSFQGTLFVGCTAAAGTFATVIKRATDGTYSTAETGSGGTAKANNGFLSLAEFSGNIYAGYWNNDTTAITSIRKSSDGTTWSVSYTGATTTLRPIIALFVDNGVLYAIGGGLGLTAAILSTTDGTTWTDLTANLPDTGETALPAFGVVVF